MKIDLHSHSTRSDGTLSPTELVEEAARRQVDVLALTDHDTVMGLPEARSAGSRLKVRILTGVELSCRDPAGEVHVLGYFPQDPPPPFLELLKSQQSQRRVRADEMIRLAQAHGMPIAWRDLEAAGAGPGNVGRPHLARALMAKGYVTTFSEAFRQWLSPEKPLYVKHQAPLPEDGVLAIREAGGVPVVAHPGHVKDPATLDRMVAAGLLGMEVHHPDHDAAKLARFSVYAAENGLIRTGGSDFHGAHGKRTARLGDLPTEPDQLARIEALWS